MQTFFSTAFAVLMGLMTSACASAQMHDPYLWLEEIHAEPSLNWVRNHNAPSTARLEGDARYADARAQAKAILEAKDRIINPNRVGEFIEEFYQDAQHVRGILRRSPLSAYRSGFPIWETLFDVDALGQAESESWVWHGKQCLPPDNARCLISLSRGGKDAEVVREWDSDKRQFVVDGFQLPEAKSTVTWLDANTLLVGTDFGPGSMTDSGYPRLTKLWRRGTPLADAQLIFEGRPQDVWVNPYVSHRPEGTVTLISRGRSFYESDTYWYKADGTLVQLPTTEHFDLAGVFQGQVIGSIKRDVQILGTAFTAGTVLAFDLIQWRAQKIYEPDAESGYASVAVNRNRLLITALKNVRSQLYEARHNAASGWSLSLLPLPSMGTISVVDADEWNDDAFALYQGFFEPTQLMELQGTRNRRVKQLPARFNATGMTVDQRWAVSRDGTRIPYFLLLPAPAKKAGKKLTDPLPTLLYGYGGFEVSEVPFYSGVTGKLWLEKGGAYALANIRGGGEFGPRWHQAALLQNRQRAFDDFAAVAEHLIQSGVTSPRKLGIQGGSNGGLLMGATFTQRPELFQAVVCQVPLLDMTRYHLLLAGASWMAEYGNPDEPRMRQTILRYSPYQNLHANKQYPEVFFMTSTEDDRVHPGHARKMAARMEEQGHPFLYFENMEGGHGGAADLEQRARMSALLYTFLYQKLMDEPAPGPAAKIRK